jgi:hypothetical protein
MHPVRRAKGLIVQHIDDETIILDKDRNKAHCLNRVAALVWQHCDGETSLTELAEAVEAAYGTCFKEGDVAEAVAKLHKIHLLEPETKPSADLVRRERRRMTRKLAMAGLAAIVTSIVVPTPAMAGSLPVGACCTDKSQCASGNCVGTGTGQACSPLCLIPGSKCCQI